MKQESPAVKRGFLWEISGIYSLCGADGILSELFLLVLIIILFLFGAKRLPQLARGLGLSINEFRDAISSNKKEIMDVMDSEKVDNETSD